MIRILQIVDHMGLGGIQAFIMNVYRNIDRRELQFDFLVHKTEGNYFQKEIESLGGKMFYVPARSQGFLKNRRALDKFFKEHTEYKVVHQHESSLSYIEPLIAAKNNGVPVRVIHSHSTRMGESKIHKILHLFNAKYIHKIATHYLACGDMAGKWFYGTSRVKDNFTIVINGISLKDFEYNEELRKEVRKELDLNDDFTVCHIGRFDWVKNHTFLIDIFNEITKLNPNSKLVLVGQGVLIDDIMKKVRKLGLTDRVLFLGLRSDINKIVQAVDVVLLPSIYEGFPVTAIEAQASGLPLFMSDTIPKEAIIKENAYALSLKTSAEEWASIILENSTRCINNTKMKSFDIGETIKVLSLIYGK